jgi:hypothetical protein
LRLFLTALGRAWLQNPIAMTMQRLVRWGGLQGGFSPPCPDISQVLSQSPLDDRMWTGRVFSVNTFAIWREFIEIYFSFTIGMLKRLSGGI